MKLFISILLLAFCTRGTAQSADYIIGRFVSTGPNIVAPVAFAGADRAITLPVNFLTLYGSAVAPGGISFYEWRKLTGGAVIFSSTSTPSVNISGLTTGTYSIELTATGATGLIGKDTIIISVNAAINIPPVVSAGIDQIVTGPVNNTSLVATASDPDGTINAYEWSQVSGPSGAIISSPTLISTTVTGLIPGVYKFQVKVTDNSGSIAIDEVQVTVEKAPEYIDTSGYVNANGRNFYFAPWGNDSRTAVEAQSPRTPWKTINKLNSIFSTLLGGDSALLRGGQSFYGSILVNKSGTASKYITLASYGGGKAKVSGFTTLSSWTVHTGQIYKAAAPAAKNSVVMVTIDGIPQEVGRFPNSDAVYGGYTNYTGYSIDTSITCTAITSTGNYVGAELVMRTEGYVVQRQIVTRQVDSVLSYRPTAQINPRNGTGSIGDAKTPAHLGFGCFIQRHPNTLDKFGEWYPDTTAKQIRMFFGANNPADYDVKVSTLDTLINVGNRKYINISGLAFDGANLAAIYTQDAGNIKIENCAVLNTGAKGIMVWNTPDLLIKNNFINHSLSTGIEVTNRHASRVSVLNNTVNNTGIFSGMSSYYDDTDAKGMVIAVDSFAEIRMNRLDTTGYVGIQFQGNKVNVDSNYINYFCFQKDDGGAIYTYSEVNAYGRNVRNNIMLNGIGAPNGNSGGVIHCEGFYSDGFAGGINVLNNTMAYISNRAIYLNGPKNMNVHGNTGWQAGSYAYNKHPTSGIFNFKLTRNTFFVRKSTHVDGYYNYGGGSIGIPNGTLPVVAVGPAGPPSTPTIAQSLYDAIHNAGTVDSNFFRYPTDNQFSWNYSIYPMDHALKTQKFVKDRSFAQWQAVGGQDTHSTITPAGDSSFYYNATMSPIIISLTGTNYLPDDTPVTGSYTLQPFNSVIFIKPDPAP